MLIEFDLALQVTRLVNELKHLGVSESHMRQFAAEVTPTSEKLEESNIELFVTAFATLDLGL